MTRKKNESIYLLGVIDQWATLIEANSKALPANGQGCSLLKSTIVIAIVNTFYT